MIQRENTIDFNTQENWDKSIQAMVTKDTWIARREQWADLLINRMDEIAPGEVAELLEKHHPDAQSLLEIGPGPGWMVFCLSRMLKAKIHAMDISPLAISIIKEHSPEVEAFVGNMNHPIPGTYDVILMSQALEHCWDLDKTLQNIMSALHENGIAIFIVPYGWTHDAQHNYKCDDKFIAHLGSYGEICCNQESRQYRSRTIVLRKLCPK